MTLVCLKGFCWGSTFQRSSIVSPINSAWSVCLHWVAHNLQAGIFRRLAYVWFDMVTAPAKVTHVGVGGLSSGAAYLFSDLVCSLDHGDKHWRTNPQEKDIRYQACWVIIFSTWEWIRKFLFLCWVVLFDFWESVSSYRVCSGVHTAARCLSSHRSSLEAAANLGLGSLCAVSLSCRGKW